MRAVRRGIAGADRLVLAAARGAVSAGAVVTSRHGRRRAVGWRLGAALVLLAAVAGAIWGALDAGSSTHPVAPLRARLAPVGQGWASVPVGERYAVSRSLGRDERAYWATPAAHGALALRNAAQGLHASLSDGSVAVAGANGLRLGLSGLSVGRGEARVAIALPAAPSVERNRVAYATPSISEWFANGPFGLEQGFTLTQRPTGSGPLVISQTFAGDVVGRAVLGGQAVTFSSPASSLRYEDLAVSDAHGRPVPAHLSVSGHRLTITIDDAGAVYPLRIDPGLVAPVSQHPATDADTGTTPFSVAFSPDGGLLAVANMGSNTVSVFMVDATTGQLTPVTQSPASSADTGSSPYAVAFSPDGGLLAAANGGSNTVSVFRVDDSTGQLTPVTQSSASDADTGSEPTSVAFSPDGDLLTTSNFIGGTVSVFTVDDSTGQLTPVTQSPASDADTGADPTSVAFSPDGGLLATSDLSSNTVSVFMVDDSTGQLTPVTQSPASNADTRSQPSSVVFSPGGSLLAVSNEDSNTVSVFTVDDSTGLLTPVTQSPTSDSDTGNEPDGVVFSPNGGLLATSNYQTSTVSVFTVDDSTGQLTPVTQNPASNADTGSEPNGLVFSPSGALLVTANGGSNTVSVLTTKATTTSASLLASATIAVGDSDSDTVTVQGNAGSGSPTGSVSFYECGPSASSCSSTANQVGSSVSVTAGPGDTATATSTALTPPSGPGTYCFYAVYSGDSNYLGSSDDGSSDGCFTADPVLNVSVSGSQTYGGTGQAFQVVSYSGFVNGQTSSIVSNSLSCSTTVAANAAVGTSYGTLSCSGVSATGYVVEYTDDGFSVTPAALTVTASNASTTYGTVPTITAQYSAFVGTQTAPATLPTCFTTDTTGTAAGSTPASICEGAADPNYTISYVNGTVTVGKASLTIKASSPSMTYGGTVPTVHPIYSGFENSDNASDLTAAPTCSITGSTPYHVGSYTTSCSGAVDSNYSFSYPTGSLTVSQAPLSALITGTETYGGTASFSVAKYVGFVNSDSSSVVSGPLEACSSSANGGDVGSYTATISGCSNLSASNYAITYVDDGFTITPASLTITASSTTTTYGTVPAITPEYSAFVGVQTAPATLPYCYTADTTSTAAGSTPASICTGAADPNYTISYVNGTVTVDKASLTAYISGSQTYGANASTDVFSVSSVGGLENGDSTSVVSGPLTGCSSTASGDPVGTYSGTITGCGGLTATNYTVTSYDSAGFTITPAALTVTASSPDTTYGTVPTITAKYTGFIGGQTAPATLPTCFTTDTTGTAAGSTPVSTCTGAADPNYTISYVTGIVNVGKAPLTITASSPTMTYGGLVPSVHPIYSGFENSDNASDLTTAPTCSITGSTPYPVGSYTTACNGAVDTNYTIGYVTGSLTVGKAPLSALIGGTETYGGTASFSVVNYIGLVNGDSGGVVSGPLKSCLSSASSNGVGTYTGTITGCSNLTASNYAVSYVDDGFTISPASLTITASSGPMTYGGTVPTITPSYTGLVNSDTAPTTTPTCSTVASASSPVGSYATSCTGAADANYTISYANGTVTVGKASLTAYVTGTRIYGASNSTAVYAVASYSSFVNGDNASVVSGPLASCTTDVAATAGVGPHSGTISGCSGLSAENYSIGYQDDGFTITPAALAITASSPSITYGGTVPTITPIYTGLVNGDGATTTAPSCSITTGSAPYAAGSYTTACSGAVDANYTISYVNGSFTVKLAPLTITASSPTITYGQQVPAITPAYTGLENGDSAPTTVPVCLTAATSSSPVGSYTTYCTGAADTNYKISYVNGSVTVNRAALTITAASPSMTYGASVPPITALYSGFVNNDNASDLTTAPSCSSTAGSAPAVGSYTTSCNSAAAANYTIGYATGSLTVNRAPLTAAVLGTQVYGSATQTYSVATYTGFVNSDGNGVVSGSPTCTSTVTKSEPVGTYLLTMSTCHGLSAANYTISYVDDGFTVTPASLVITAANETMTYGDAVPVVTPIYGSFVNGDTPASLTTQPTCFTPAVPSSPANVPPVVNPIYPPTLCDDAADPNYTITYEPGSVTVKQAPMTITASSATIIYGGTVPAITPSYQGFVNDDSTTSFTTLPSCSTSTTPLSTVAGSPYATNCTGTVDPNYAFTYVPGKITVDPAPLTITVTGQQIYGGTPSFEVSAYSGFVNSQTWTVLGGALAGCATSAIGTTPAGVYQGRISGCGGFTDTNYAISYADGGFTVTDAATSSVSAIPLLSIQVGDSEADNVVVTGNVVGGAPTGTVAFYECGVETLGVTPCATGGTQVGPSIELSAASDDTATASSVAFTPTSGPGTYCFRAQYSGDNNYDGSADGTTDECFAVTAVGAPQTSAPTESSIALGQLNADHVTVQGNAAGGSPTGQVTFYACNPGTTPCSSGGSDIGVVDLVGATGDTSTATSPNFLPTAGPGTYCFRSVYSGDNNYGGSTEATGAECFTVTQATSSTVSAPNFAVITTGESDRDVLTVHGNAGGGSPTGSVSFYICGPGVSSCASTTAPLGGVATLGVGANDDSTAYSAYFTPPTTGTYCFYAVYSGDANYQGSSDATGDGCFTVGTAASQASPAAPSNVFTITSHKFKKDVVDVTLALPGAGSIALSATHGSSAKALASHTADVTAAGELTVKLSLSKKAKASVASAAKGNTKYYATVTITFTPTGGSANTKTLRILLAK